MMQDQQTRHSILKLILFLGIVGIPLIIATTVFAETDTFDQNNYARKEWSATGEVSWNGLGGVGPQLHYQATPYLPIDIGIGISSVGIKGGVRGRYLFMPQKKLSPFIGAGLAYGLGSGGRDVDIEIDNVDHTVRINESPFAQASCGIDYQAKNGFRLIASVGYSYLLRDNNVEKVKGDFSANDQKVIDDVFKSGIMAAINVGFSF